MDRPNWVIQMDDGGFEKNGGNGSEVKWTDSRYFVMIEPKDLADGLAVEMGKERKQGRI